MADAFDTHCPVPEFPEQAYLDNNPDVSAAVSAGVFRSGWDHFLLYGHAEDRPGAPQTIDPAIERVLKDPRGSPMPPPALRVRVHGAADPASFLRLGKTVAFDLHAALAEQGIDAGAAHRILDFGCGCGRVLPWLAYLYPESRLAGTDIDAESIGWCQRHLADLATFQVNREHPPLDAADEAFDIVYSISIFTHLPEAMQLAWLAELSRVTRPGGLLLLTVRGARFFPGRPRRGRRELAKRGFFYLKGKGTQGLPDFYQTSYHDASYIRRAWSRYFEILDLKEEAIGGRQDLIVGRKRSE